LPSIRERADRKRRLKTTFNTAAGENRSPSNNDRLAKVMTVKRYILLCGVAALIVGCATGSPNADSAPSPQESQMRSACAAAGLDPHEAPFAYCILSLRQQAHPQYASDDNSRRARLACAGMGYDGASEAYATCVGNLTQTLFDAQNIGSR
jgi:hypothetical protein